MYLVRSPSSTRQSILCVVMGPQGMLMTMTCLVVDRSPYQVAAYCRREGRERGVKKLFISRGCCQTRVTSISAQQISIMKKNHNIFIFLQSLKTFSKSIKKSLGESAAVRDDTELGVLSSPTINNYAAFFRAQMRDPSN